jgi:hypothetical protein
MLYKAVLYLFSKVSSTKLISPISLVLLLFVDPGSAIAAKARYVPGGI